MPDENKEYSPDPEKKTERTRPPSIFKSLRSVFLGATTALFVTAAAEQKLVVDPLAAVKKAVGTLAGQASDTYRVSNRLFPEITGSAETGPVTPQDLAYFRQVLENILAALDTLPHLQGEDQKSVEDLRRSVESLLQQIKSIQEMHTGQNWSAQEAQLVAQQLADLRESLISVQSNISTARMRLEPITRDKDYVVTVAETFALVQNVLASLLTKVFVDELVDFAFDTSSRFKKEREEQRKKQRNPHGSAALAEPKPDATEEDSLSGQTAPVTNRMTIT